MAFDVHTTRTGTYTLKQWRNSPSGPACHCIDPRTFDPRDEIPRQSVTREWFGPGDQISQKYFLRELDLVHVSGVYIVSCSRRYHGVPTDSATQLRLYAYHVNNMARYAGFYSYYLSNNACYTDKTIQSYFLCM